MIVLDTHAWVWWVADKAKLSRPARRAIERAKRLVVADISLWEVSMLVAKGRLLVDRDVTDWLSAATTAPGIGVMPIRPDIAARSSRLGREFQGDPADRLIVATALALGATLVTKDERIRAYAPVDALW